MTFSLEGNPLGVDRYLLYGGLGVPTVGFDGTLFHSGLSSAAELFMLYEQLFLERREIPSPLIMSANWKVVDDQASLQVEILVDLPVTTQDNEILFFLCLGGFPNSYAYDDLPSQPFHLTEVGQSLTVTREFTMPSYPPPEAWVAVILVQDRITHEVLQAAWSPVNSAGIVRVACFPDEIRAPWRLQGPEGLDISGSGRWLEHVNFVGDYTLTWGDVPFWTLTSPAVQTRTLVQDGLVDFEGIFTGGPFTTESNGPLSQPGLGQGTGLVDVDGDGDLDAHLVRDGEADLLLLNDGLGQFTAASAGPINDTGAGRGAAWADFNGDGNLDCALARFDQPNLLFCGDGNGGFTPAAGFGFDDAGSGQCFSWVDFDLDGCLDLYLVNWGQANQLLRGLGDLGDEFYIFMAQGWMAADPGYGSSAAWADFNRDGRMDLFLTNAGGPNVLYENMTIGMQDVTTIAGLLADAGPGAGAAWGDFNNDNRLDLYVANAGDNDILYDNCSNGLLTLVTGENLGDNGYGHGVVWADFDNDGHLDLYLTRVGQSDLMLQGDGTGDFTLVPMLPGVPDTLEGANQALACGDVDGDGDVDLLISRQEGPAVLYRNNLSDGSHWLKVRLTGTAPNTSAIGARVSLVAGGETQTRQITAGGGYLCMNPLETHFGLGSATRVDQVVIDWPDGEQQVLNRLAPDCVINLVQGENPATPTQENPTQLTTRLGPARPNPFNPRTMIEYTLAQAGEVRLEIFAVDGRRVATLVAEHQGAGSHRAVWQGTDDAGRTVASGTYFASMQIDTGPRQTGSLTLIR